jgi:hypothetical protein
MQSAVAASCEGQQIAFAQSVHHELDLHICKSMHGKCEEMKGGGSAMSRTINNQV